MHLPEIFEARYEDIFAALAEGEITTIIHGMNRKSSFRSGFSRQLAEHFPEAVEADDLDLALNGKHRKGNISVGVVGSANGLPLRVINLYCMRNNHKDGSLLSLNQLETSLHLVNAVLAGEDGHVVGFPRIGAGIAGHEWDEVAEVIDEMLTVERFLYRPEEDLNEAIANGEAARGSVVRRTLKGEKVRIDFDLGPSTVSSTLY